MSEDRVIPHSPFPIPHFATTVVTNPQGEASARVYFLVAPTVAVSADELSTYRLSGQIVGPTCRYSTTLQAKIPLKPAGLTRWGDRTAVVAEAVVPDPCYWSPDLPFLYRAAGEITSETGLREPLEQTFGIRSLGVVRNRIVFNGRVWVPRGARLESIAADTTLDAWRKADLAIVADRPEDELLRSASETGVWIFAEVPDDRATALVELARLGRYPSVACAIFSDLNQLDDAFRTTAPNVLLARRTEVAEKNANDNVTTLLVPTLSESTISQASNSDLPQVYDRPRNSRTTTIARENCDLLQRDLAGRCDAAGYLT